MKKNKICATAIVLSLYSLLSARSTFADVLFPGDPKKLSSTSNTFLDLIQPQHIIIGGTVLVIIVISFAILFNIKKK